MMQFCKVALIVSFLALGACGESKVTAIDGTSPSTAKASITQIKMSLKGAERDTFEADLIRIQKQYKNPAEFAKALDGKDVAGVHEVGKGSWKYLLDKSRAVQTADIEKSRDEAKEKVDYLLKNDPRGEQAPLYGVLKPRLDMYEAKLAEMKGLSDEEFVKKYDLDF